MTKKVSEPESSPASPSKISSKAKTSADGKMKDVDSFSSIEIFGKCIERAENLVKIHQAAHGEQSKPEKYLADAHRAAVVLAISALDAFIRSYAIERIRGILADKKLILPGPLADRIKKFLDVDGLLDAARKDDLLDRVEKAFQADFEKRSFQGVKNIDEVLKLIGITDVFHVIAQKAKVNEDTLKKDLEDFTKRRHTIAHKGDYDLNVQPPKELVITKKDVRCCIKTVTIIAQQINGLE